MPNSFYTLESYAFEDSRVLAAIRFDPEHPIFSGHFPGRPVVPGVCMVQIVKQLVVQASRRQGIFLSEGHQLKFLQPIVPDRNELVQISVTIEQGDNRLAIQAAFKNGDATLFKMTGTFTLPEQKK